MQKILYIAVSSQIGGVPKHILDALRRAKASGYDITVAVPDDGDYYPQFREYAADMVKVRLKPYSFRSLMKLCRYVRKNRIKLVHSHGKGAGMYARPMKLLCPGIRVVHTFHGVYIEKYGKAVRTVYCLIERSLKHLTDRFVCVSEGEKEEALGLGFADERRTDVIANGTEPERFASTEADRDGGLKEFGFPQDACVIGCVARLEAMKGLSFLLEAFAKVVEKYPTCRLLIAGDGPDREHLVNQIRESGLDETVKLAGFRQDVPQLLKLFDIYVSASLKEGMPYALLEALAAERPVVATDVTGNRDIIENGRTGLLVKPGDADALYRGLCYAAEHPQECRAWGSNGRKTVSERFTVQKSWEQLLRVYEQVMAEKA